MFLALETQKTLYESEKKHIEPVDSFTFRNHSYSQANLEYSGKAKLDGLITYWIYRAEEDEEVKLSYSMNLEKGKIKLFFVKAEDNITEILKWKKEIQKKVVKSIYQLKKVIIDLELQQ